MLALYHQKELVTVIPMICGTCIFHQNPGAQKASNFFGGVLKNEIRRERRAIIFLESPSNLLLAGNFKVIKCIKTLNAVYYTNFF